MISEYEELWKNLELIVLELIKQGEDVPKGIIDDLKSAKTLINIYKADNNCLDAFSKAEVYLRKVEMDLINIGEEKLGKEHLGKILEKSPREKFIANNFKKNQNLSNLPKKLDFIRLKPGTLKKENIETLVKELKLNYEIKKDGYVIISGDKEKIKSLVKKISIYFKKS